MKKIISTVIVSALIAVPTINSVNAMWDWSSWMSWGWMNMSWNSMMWNWNMKWWMMWNWNMIGNWMKMWKMNWMSWMMDSEIVKKRQALMKKVSDSIDEQGKKDLEEMKMIHMWDMKEFMKKFPWIDMTEEKKIAKEEMKNKHFADLKEILKDNISLYNEVSSEMETLMDDMEEKMHSNKWMSWDWMNGTKWMNMWSNSMMWKWNMNWWMKWMKKRMFSMKTQNRMDGLVDKLFTKLNNFDTEKKNDKIKSILNKVEKAKKKYELIEDVEKKEKINSILDYLVEKLTEKSWMNMGWMEMWEMEKGWMMWNMWWGEIFDNDIEWLEEAKPTRLVILKDGDTYKMDARAVKQEVWNRYIKRLAYNGMIPWPIIQVEKGGKIKLEFTNNLEIETTLHPHGLRLEDSRFDGLPIEMGWEQKNMKPGETFVYELDFPDTGVFWYHPHLREDYTQEMWLYGNFSVTEKDYWNLVDREEFMILDDFSSDDVFYKDKVNKTLMWRFGNIMMINNDENYNLDIKQYETARLYLTNVANTRTFDFGIYKNWKEIDLKLVWGDIGRIEKEEMIKTQIIAPAERYIVEARFDEEWEYIIKSQERILWKITVEKSDTAVKQKAFWSELKEDTTSYKFLRDNFNTFLEQKIDKKLSLTIWMQWSEWSMWSMQMDNTEEDTDEIEWEDNMAMMNKMSSDKMMEWKMVDIDTGKENMDIEWKFKKGEFVKVEIYNDPNSAHPMQHPIHFHGQRFVVLTRDWKVQKNLQWKDVSLIKNGERVEILIEMTNEGNWMSHCHIAEHLQSGMMMTFQVEK